MNTVTTSLSERLDTRIAETFSVLRRKYGGLKDDYYGLAYLEAGLGIEQSQAAEQVAFGGADLGVDGFHLDLEDGHFRLFQFKNTESPATIATSMHRLATAGVPALFDGRSIADHQPIVDAARKALTRARLSLRQFSVDFVFRGDPDAIERRTAIASLRERIQEHEGRLHEFLGRSDVQIEVRFFKFDGLNPPAEKATAEFLLRMSGTIETTGPDGARMWVGFTPLVDFLPIHRALGRKLFDQNVRFALPPRGHVNTALQRAFKEALLTGERDPSAFAFSHNGITLSARTAHSTDDGLMLRIPRLLNGAQTVSTLVAFADRQGSAFGNAGPSRLNNLKVLCRVVAADPPTISRITIDTNRQNPVEPWLLRANDLVQMELADRFRDMGLYYQRQANAMQSMTAEDREAERIVETKPIDLLRLARTFLAAEGALARLIKVRDVFEDENQYNDLFGEHRLSVDLRLVLVCYKVQHRLNMLTRDIRETASKYEFVDRAREIVWALTCQAFLNDEARRDRLAEEFGRDLSFMKPSYAELLGGYAKNKVRHLLSDVISAPEFAEKARTGDHSFLRTTAAFNKAMERAHSRYGWSVKRLRG